MGHTGSFVTQEGTESHVALETIYEGNGFQRIVCLPHAGGSASWFHAWKNVAKRMNVTLEAVQYPGHAGLLSCNCAQSIEHLASLVNVELADEGDDVILFGHSMGALVAFEAAFQAERQGARYRGLHLSASRPPCLPCESIRSGLVDEMLIEEIGALDPLFPNALECREIADLFLPIVRDDFRMAERYRCQRSLGVWDIDVHCGRGDTEFSLEEAHSWCLHTEGAVRVHEYPGGHFYLRDRGVQMFEIFIESAGASR